MTAPEKLNEKDVAQISRESLALINKIGNNQLNAAETNQAIDTVAENKKRLKEAQQQNVQGAVAALGDIDKLLSLTIDRRKESAKKNKAAETPKRTASTAPKPNKTATPTLEEIEKRYTALTGKKPPTQAEIIERTKKAAWRSTPAETPKKNRGANTPPTQKREPAQAQPKPTEKPAAKPQPGKEEKPAAISPKPTKNEADKRLAGLENELAKAKKDAKASNSDLVASKKEQQAMRTKLDKVSRQADDQIAKMQAQQQQMQTELTELRGRMKEDAPTAQAAAKLQQPLYPDLDEMTKEEPTKPQAQTPSNTQEPTVSAPQMSDTKVAKQTAPQQPLYPNLDEIMKEEPKKPQAPTSSNMPQPTVNERPAPTVNDTKQTTQTSDASQAKGAPTNKHPPQKQSTPGPTPLDMDKLQASLPKHLQGLPIYTNKNAPKPTDNYTVAMNKTADSKTVMPLKGVLENLKSVHDQRNTKQPAKDEKLSKDAPSDENDSKNNPGIV